MTENCHHPASFSEENMFFEDYSFGSPMSEFLFRCFFQLILNCFICNYNIKVKNSMDFLVGLEKEEAHFVVPIIADLH